MKIVWPDLTFPAINLWSYPMRESRSMVYLRYKDMYCADELEAYYHYGSLVDLQRLKTAQSQFKAIWDLRNKDWS